MVFRVVVLQMCIRSTFLGLQKCIVCLKLSQGAYYMSNSKGSGKTAQMRSLASAFAGRLCDKYSFLMCWPIFMACVCSR